MHFVLAIPEAAVALPMCKVTRGAVARNVGQQAISSAGVRRMLANQSRHGNLPINMLKGCSPPLRFQGMHCLGPQPSFAVHEGQSLHEPMSDNRDTLALPQ